MSEKRFPASLKKQREAKLRGDTPRSALLTKGAALLGGVLGCWWQAPSLRRSFVETPWLGWAESWEALLGQLSWSLALICGSAALGAYIIGSLAGGFLFSAGSLRGRPGLSRLAPRASFFLSFGLSLIFVVGSGYLGVRWGAELSWALGASDERLFVGALGSLFVYLVLSLGLAVLLGALQAVLAWYLWSQQQRRTSPEFMQDSKDEEGKAKQFFSSKITTQTKRPG